MGYHLLGSRTRLAVCVPSPLTPVLLIVHTLHGSLAQSSLSGRGGTSGALNHQVMAGLGQVGLA